jgi:carbonic anhydrase/acetyltransferase-like protein (isoleucine patch superfamily)
MNSDYETYKGMHPQVDADAFVHESAQLTGDVHLARGVSIWHGCVLRGDQGSIRIGEESNIQDLSVIHCTGGLSEVRIGCRVTVGHRTILHGCIIDDDCLVGMGAILMDNCHIEPWCIIGAGALIPAGRRIPSGSLVLGSPGRVVREIRPEERDSWIRHGHQEYMRLAVEHKRLQQGRVK